MRTVVVFADVACPFTHVGLRRFASLREARGELEPVLRVRAWPLELVNGAPLDGPALQPKIDALRADVAPDLFEGFDADHFPATTLPAMAAEAAAYRHGIDVGEGFALAVRDALFEDGLDVSDPEVLAAIAHAHGVDDVGDADRAAVLRDLERGRELGVVGSPHFFTGEGSFFCPSLEIDKGADGYHISFDATGFHRFAAAVFG